MRKTVTVRHNNKDMALPHVVRERNSRAEKQNKIRLIIISKWLMLYA